MSDYTPSRSVVREAYLASREFAFFCDEDYRRLARAEFDRWLAKERRKAKAEGWDEGYAQGVIYWAADESDKKIKKE